MQVWVYDGLGNKTATLILNEWYDMINEWYDAVVHGLDTHNL